MIPCRIPLDSLQVNSSIYTAVMWDSLILHYSLMLTLVPFLTFQFHVYFIEYKAGFVSKGSQLIFQMCVHVYVISLSAFFSFRVLFLKV